MQVSFLHAHILLKKNEIFKKTQFSNDIENTSLIKIRFHLFVTL